MKAKRNIENVNLIQGAPYGKWKTLTTYITKKYFDEEANLSGLDPSDQITTMVMDMMQEAEENQAR